MHRAVTSTLLTVLLTIALASCGSVSDDRHKPGTGQPQYQAFLFNPPAEDRNIGKVSLDISGIVTTQITGAALNTTYKLQFCPAPAQNYSCFDVGDVATDASGNANVNIKFPKSGSWAGDFHVNSGGTTQFETDVAPNGHAQVYLAALQPATTTNRNGVFVSGGPPGPQDLLGSGTVAFKSGMMQFQLKGASQNTTYTSSQCPTFFGSSCYGLYDLQNNAGFTTDGSGNVSFSVQTDSVPGDIFQVWPPSGRSGFVSGFKVP